MEKDPATGAWRDPERLKKLEGIPAPLEVVIDTLKFDLDVLDKWIARRRQLISELESEIDELSAARESIDEKLKEASASLEETKRCQQPH